MPESTPGTPATPGTPGIPPTPPLSAPRRGVRLAGTGAALPPRVVTNDDLAKLVDTNDEWIAQRTGIKQRRLVDPGMTVRTLATAAIQQALAHAAIDAKQLDLVLIATLTPEMCTPSTACRVVADLGAVPAGALDISAACSGFVYGLNLAASLIQTGMYRTIAVAGAETLSKITDWKDRRTCVLFGDGAGAAILTASDDPHQGSLYHSMASNGDHWLDIYCPKDAGDVPANDHGIFSGAFNTIQMNGREIYKFAVSTLQKTVLETCARAGVTLADVKMVIPHQSNARILESAREKLGLSAERLYINIDRFGNTSAASVPICLHELTAAGTIAPGDLVLFVALGGGLTWATNLWRL